jgi:NAD(P)-dependent dehydrogenase (short-subunit alcohol dehydrogenase family)
MPRTVLLTEGDSPLGGALTRLLAARGFNMIATRERSDSSRSTGALGGVHSVVWNRRSPVSARTVLLDALNFAGTPDQSGSIDEAIILEPPPPGSAAFLDASSADIEKTFDDAKGPIFMAREILTLFAKRGSGVLAFVLRGSGDGLLEAGLRESLRGAASALLASPPATTILVNGFQANSTHFEEYAQFIDRTLDERARRISGRWFTCTSRGGFFRKMPPGAADRMTPGASG